MTKATYPKCDQVDYYGVIIPQQIKKRCHRLILMMKTKYTIIPNFHSEEQEQFEIPDEVK
ncbi:hypothetical protein C1645_838062 [Glomus cerebriforme]|uniref:Uncharacterized protein n=1 Tax=Glomus cerebriforme TaxID=658196 RepID=A0A397S304_9GLOM|nr:hypothetical protein C1645_838062 [Glomus cerebriforme]